MVRLMMTNFRNHDSEDHHLIYREELKKDGSLHNCVECGNRPVHRYHASSKNHYLEEFTEKLENDGNKQVVCSGCDDPVLMGPAYKCSVSKCSFFIHKSCSELFPQINHPMHPNHTLNLKCLDNKYCDACSTSHKSSFIYDCNSCDFSLDIKWAYDHLPINPTDCHQHELFSIWRKMQINCDACGEEITDLAYGVCNICKILVHTRCAKTPRTVKIKLHNHFLNLIYSLREINKRDDMICRICCNKVKGEYAAYSCQKCSYDVHTKCLIRFRDEYGGESLETGETVGHATHLIKALNQVEDEGPHPVEIQHFSHQQHKLILCHDEIKDDKLCKGCMEFIISVPFYSCARCNFFLHTRCAKLPTRIVQYRLFRFLNFTLLSRASNNSDVFFCDICSRHHRGFTYERDDSQHWHLCVQCGPIPEILQHEGHQHSLFCAIDSKRKCNVCSKDKEKSLFVCTICDFALGIRCANLPLVAKHKYDTHLLKLTYNTDVKDSGEYYCLICEEERDPNHWFYYCEECDFPAHVECVLGNYPQIVIGSTYKSEYHQHPLTFVQKSENSICDSCYDQFDDVALECSQCKLKVHPRPPTPFSQDCLWALYERNLPDDDEDECNSPDDDDDNDDNDDERNSPDDDNDDDSTYE